jgi:hypothetical protein
LQFGVDAARRLELEAAGAGPGDGWTFDGVRRQQVAGPSDPIGSREILRLARRLPARPEVSGSDGRAAERSSQPMD